MIVYDPNSNFSVVSHTVDINQTSAGSFAVADYAGEEDQSDWRLSLVNQSTRRETE